MKTHGSVLYCFLLSNSSAIEYEFVKLLGCGFMPLNRGMTLATIRVLWKNLGVNYRKLGGDLLYPVRPVNSSCSSCSHHTVCPDYRRTGTVLRTDKVYELTCVCFELGLGTLYISSAVVGSEIDDNGIGFSCVCKIVIKYSTWPPLRWAVLG